MCVCLRERETKGERESVSRRVVEAAKGGGGSLGATQPNLNPKSKPKPLTLMAAAQGQGAS
jgi:hypothetical protein